MQAYIDELKQNSAHQIVNYMLGQTDAFDIEWCLLEFRQQIEMFKPDIVFAFGKLASLTAMYVKPKFKVLFDLCCRPDLNMSESQLAAHKY